MSNESIPDQLNHLIAVNKESEAAFQTAVDNVRNSELETLFTGYATQHARFAQELAHEIERIQKEPSDSESLGGSANRVWMDLKATLTGHSAGSMLSSCENVERSTESAYLDALEVIKTGQPHTLLEKHCEQIKGFRTRLGRLVGELEDGLDFQKNEK